MNFTGTRWFCSADDEKEIVCSWCVTRDEWIAEHAGNGMLIEIDKPPTHCDRCKGKTKLSD